MNKFISTVMMVLVLLTFNSLAKVKNLTSEQLIAAQKKGTVVIDIRTPDEWDEIGIIPNSVKIMFFDQKRKALINEFMAEFQKLVTSKDQPFILVCRTGSRTRLVTNFLDQKVGYKNGAHLAHGIKQWIEEKREVEKKTVVK